MVMNLARSISIMAKTIKLEQISHPPRKRVKPNYWFLPGVKKAVVMKMSRAIHAYLSAFAFLALMFFALTGFLLNHPKLVKSKHSKMQAVEEIIPVEKLEDFLSMKMPNQAVAAYVSKNFKVVGEYKSGEIVDDEVMLRFASVKGATTVFIDVTSGNVSLELKKSNTSGLIRELHRGKDASGAWRLMIDIVACITLLLSLVGFFLFFTIRYRLATSLKLCGVSLAIFTALFIFTIP